jgi:hypothetical protein
MINQEKQNNYLYDIKKLVDSIRNTRVLTGEDPTNHNQIWQEIDNLYNKLDYKHQEEFNNYVS